MTADEIRQLADLTAENLAASDPFVTSLARAISSRMYLVSVADWPRGKLAIGEFEAAKLLDVGASTLYRLRRSGAIAYTKIQGRVLYTAANLADFLESVQSSGAKSFLESWRETE